MLLVLECLIETWTKVTTVSKLEMSHLPWFDIEEGIQRLRVEC